MKRHLICLGVGVVMGGFAMFVAWVAGVDFDRRGEVQAFALVISVMLGVCFSGLTYNSFSGGGQP